jgi:membrane protease YdiL (CAAX protease family)
MDDTTTAPDAAGGTRRAPAEDRVETWLVLWVCGGVFIASSVLALFFQTLDGPLMGTPSRFGRLLCTETLLAIAFVPFLHARGWRLARATRPWAWGDAPRGIALFVVQYAVYVTLVMVVRRLGGGAVYQMVGKVPWFVVIAASVLNPIFEEFLYLGYTVNALRRYGLWVAVAVSVALRTAVHAYQGWSALLYILPTGLVFAAYYVRTHRIWPVVIAHALEDAIALLYMH